MVGASGQHGELFGPYEVYEQIGAGGMATVHRALKRGLAGFEHAVGLKRLLPQLAADAEFVRAFVREAKLASRLQHANIVQIYELGRVGDTYFMAMEYVRGHDLRELLRRALHQRRHVPAGVVVALLAQLCDALDYAHTRTDDSTGAPLGIVHRDISPSNLLVTSAGLLKVIDFGIARATAELTCGQRGRVRGKLAYMSPEAINGRAIDARSDIFSAGIVAHELLAGRPLFASKSDHETLRKIHRGEVLPPSTYNREVPAPLDELILRALATRPEQRYATAAELRAALHDATRSCGLRASATEIAAWLSSTLGDRSHAIDVERALNVDDIDTALTEIVWGKRTPHEARAATAPELARLAAPPLAAIAAPPPVARRAPTPRGFAGASPANVSGGPYPSSLEPRITYRGATAAPRLPPPLPPPPPRPEAIPVPERLARGTAAPPTRAPSTNRPPGVPLPARPRQTAEVPVVPQPIAPPPTPSEEPSPALLLAAIVALAAVIVALATWLIAAD